MSCTVIGKFQMGGRTCEVLAFHTADEPMVSGNAMVVRGEEARASMSKEDGKFFERHVGDVPSEFWVMFFVFPNWRHPNDDRIARFYDRLGHWWCRDWRDLEDGWNGYYVLVRFDAPAHS